MDKREATGVILAELAPYRELPYTALVSLIKEVRAYHKKGPSGTVYQIEIEAMWDDRAGGNVRVWGSIDDAGLRAFLPLSECFIKSPSGEFVDE